jgi:hypothetical protein
MRKLLYYLFLFSSILLITCQKELSYETGGAPSHGSLLDDGSGDCYPKTVNGVYEAGTALSQTTNTIQVTVNVTKTGNYTIFSDTINGYYFRATGIFSTVGSNSVTLKGYGTPATSGVNNFLLQYDSTACNVAVTVLPAGAGGPAQFTILSSGTPAVCSTSGPTGNYVVGTALNASNRDTFNINVTTIGTYNVKSDTVNGIYFSASGTFTTTGNQQLVLMGQGTPTGSAGTVTLHVTVGSSTCSFQVTITSGAVGTLGGAGGTCTPPASINGTYTQGTALTSANTVQVQINVTTAGAYSISTNTVSGFSFSGSGNAVTGTQLVTLNGTGTPTASGPVVFTVTFGSSTCTFTINVAAAPVIDYFPRTTNSNWSYEWNDTPTDSVYKVVIPATLTVPPSTVYNIFMPNDGTGSGLDSTGNYPAGYYRKNNSDYYEWFNYGNFIGYDNPGWAEYIMLKDNVPAGTNWTSNGFAGTIGGNPYNIRFSYTILQKDVPLIVTTSLGTANYTNVIIVEEKYQMEVTPGNWQDITSLVGSGKSYYARNIGLVLYEVYDTTNTKTDWMELRRYVVY